MVAATAGHLITYFQAIVIGLLQGVTELFPISSLGHAVILPKLLGWDKKRIRQFVWENTQNSHAHLKRTQRMTGALQPGDETKLRPLVATPDDILVVAAGGRAGAFSGYIPGWSSAKSSQAVTKEVKR